MSHPTWVRGLKLLHVADGPNGVRSHPTWVRGLKLFAAYLGNGKYSRTLRGCVD